MRSGYNNTWVLAQAILAQDPSPDQLLVQGGRPKEGSAPWRAAHHRGGPPLGGSHWRERVRRAPRRLQQPLFSANARASAPLGKRSVAPRGLLQEARAAMAWQVAQRRRQQPKPDASMRALAEQLRAALLPRPRAGSGRRPEWTCGGCNASNWTDRRACRRCGQAPAPPRSAAQSAPTVAPRPPRPWPEPRASPGLPSVVAAAAAAGASATTVEALRKDAENQRDERRSAGGRLDAARARAARAQRQADEAKEAARVAAERAAATEAAAALALADLKEVEASVAAAPEVAPCAPTTVVAEVRKLLAALESAPLNGTPGQGPALPEAVLSTMVSLRRQVDEPTPAGRLDEALSPSARDRPATCAPSDASVPGPDDSIMEALESADEADDAAMAAIARRLKRVRRDGPY